MTTTKWPRPLDSRVLLQVYSSTEEHKTDAGIILGTALTDLPRGVVIAVGPGRSLMDGGHEQLQVKDGDHVVFDPGIGRGRPERMAEYPNGFDPVATTARKIPCNGEQLVLIDHAEILAVVVPPESFQYPAPDVDGGLAR